MDCVVSPFGKIGNEKLWLYTFITEGGLEISITNYGATITTINLIRGDRIINLAYGYQNLHPYTNSQIYAGGLIGRFANRIKDASFAIDGETSHLSDNDGGNTLHGGIEGFNKRIWEVHFFENNKGVCKLCLHLQSPDKDQGFPGNLDIWATYQITDDNQVSLNYLAKTDRPTHVNLTTHSYFNLTGFESNVHDLLLQINAKHVLSMGEGHIPTGDIAEVNGTPFDFTKPTSIGSNLSKLNADVFDCCYVLNEPVLEKPAAMLKNARTGVKLTIHTNQPAIQLFTPLQKPHEPTIGLPTDGCWAVCLEPQHFPNSPNIPSFPTTLLTPNRDYNHTAMFRFDVGE